MALRPPTVEKENGGTVWMTPADSCRVHWPGTICSPPEIVVRGTQQASYQSLFGNTKDAGFSLHCSWFIPCRCPVPTGLFSESVFGLMSKGFLRPFRGTVIRQLNINRL